MTNAPGPTSDPPEISDDDSSSKGPPAGVATLILHHSITVLILVMVIGLGVWSYLNLQSTDLFASVDRAELEAELHPPLTTAQSQRIETAAEVYHLVYDAYPSNLDELVEAGFLLPSDVYYPRGHNSWSYERHTEGFTLEQVSHDSRQ